MASKRNHIKIFVASTVYNFEFQLDKIYELLDNYGYDVFMSHKGTLPIDSNHSNLENCLKAVEECDVFIGLIRPDYGSGVLEGKGKSIIHQEFDKARERRLPRFVLADYRVIFTRLLFRGAYCIEEKAIKKINFDDILFPNLKVMDTRCIRMYNEAILDNEKEESRRIGNWVQEYFTLDDIRLHLDSQFRFPEKIRKLIIK
jgi:hypothetical protein